ncbi:MAG: DMT family transporter [Calditrichaceae bacterium]|nr:DMT family transporter [Calditrichaceae bacterium]MBN2707861.1 DMT family transporter [Calditrichaceae bacterium]
MNSYYERIIRLACNSLRSYIGYMPVTFALIIGVFIISWSSIIIRLMGDVDPMIISFYRLSISAIILMPLWKNTDFKKIHWHSSGKLMLLAGFFLALHFYTWITSLQLTTVGNSIFLESTHPLFGLLFSVLFLKEKPGLRFIPVIFLGLSGMFIIVFRDINLDPDLLSGDLYAVAGAIFVAAYLIAARKTGKNIPLIPYLTLVYGIAAVFLLIAMLLKNICFWSLPLQTWLWLLLLALGPSFIGHSILNWASRKIPVYYVNTALLSEAVLATVFAALILQEIPGFNFYIGAVLIIIAVIRIFRQRKVNEINTLKG